MTASCAKSSAETSGELAPVIPLALVGPTGVGKTAAAVAVCRQLDAEIVSIDSRQVFGGLQICSNAPTLKDLRGVRCHLVGCLAVGERVNAARYVQMARPVMEDLVMRGKRPVLTAGTGLYLKALLDGLDLGGYPSDPGLRAGLELEAKSDLPRLSRRLESLDPEAAAAVDAANPTRVVRAVELALRRHRGEARETSPARPLATLKIGLTAPRAELYEWIERRADIMLTRGWRREIEALVGSRTDLGASALSSIGVREMVAVVQGKMGVEELRTVVVKRTRNYAKRQLTWFRADPAVRWLDVTRYPGSDIVGAILGLIEKA